VPRPSSIDRVRLFEQVLRPPSGRAASSVGTAEGPALRPGQARWPCRERPQPNDRSRSHRASNDGARHACRGSDSVAILPQRAVAQLAQQEPAKKICLRPRGRPKTSASIEEEPALPGPVAGEAVQGGGDVSDVSAGSRRRRAAVLLAGRHSSRPDPALTGAPTKNPTTMRLSGACDEEARPAPLTFVRLRSRRGQPVDSSEITSSIADRWGAMPPSVAASRIAGRDVEAILAGVC